MIQTILIKSFIPFAIGAMLSAASIVGILHATKQPIKVECPQAKVNVACPPPIVEGNNLDIDKLKRLKGNLTIHQDYHIKANGDSLITQRLIDSIRIELKRLKISRCK